MLLDAVGLASIAGHDDPLAVEAAPPEPGLDTTSKGTGKSLILYVDDDAMGNNDGSGWKDAFVHLQDALAVASERSEIWVAEGTYWPDQGQIQTAGDRMATFTLANDVKILGGFAGVGQSDPNARDVDAFETILSGDLAGNDEFVYGSDTNHPSRHDNSYHVVTGSNTDESAVLDGFTITAGHANGGWEGKGIGDTDRGGGMYIDHGSPTVIDSTFTLNTAISWEGGLGGGMFSMYSSSTLIDCDFLNNRADTQIPDHGAGNGGAIAEFDSNLTLINSTFIGNSAGGNDGGAIYSGGDLTLIESTFTGNFARQGGGAVYNAFGALTLEDSTFEENQALNGGAIFTAGNMTLVGGQFTRNYTHSEYGRGGAIFLDFGNIRLIDASFIGDVASSAGGAIYNEATSLVLTNSLFDGTAAPSGAVLYNASASEVTLTNCTMAGASAGPAIVFDSSNEPSHAIIRNSILWNDEEEILNNDGSTIAVTYSNIQGGWDGEGNIDADPMFVDPDGTNNWPGDKDDLLQLRPGSPCIDAGDNRAVPADTFDLDGDEITDEPMPWDLENMTRFIDDSHSPDTGRGLPPIVDMGAYEYDHGPAPPARLYVDASARGANNGTSWEAAINDLQAALDVAYWGGTTTEIWVAAGTYRPSARTMPNDPRTETFQLLNGVALYGGFAGGETSLAERNAAANETILSGDLFGNDEPVPGGDSPKKWDNAYHVVTGMYTDETAVLDGFTITGGNAFGPAPDSWIDYNAGGGMYNDAWGPTVNNCTFRGNQAMYGGAMVPGYSTVTNSVFTANSAVGLWSDGGAIFNLEYYPTFINCTFTGNWTEHDGGAGAIASQEAITTVINSILWDNTGEQAYGVDVTFSSVEGGMEGEGNIALDPLMIDADGPDNLFGTADDNVRLSLDSPSIDLGNTEAVPPYVLIDPDGRPRIDGDSVDAGAYEAHRPLVIYVDDDAPGSENGSSWSDAYHDLQDALAVAGPADEIRVAQGTYTPTSDGDRSATFQLISQVAITGGYAGYGEAYPDARDVDAYETILSGDLAGDDAPITDPYDLWHDVSRAENSLHVVTGNGTDATAVLDGFTITGGKADDGQGGGAINFDGTPTYRDCLFINNWAEKGGGMYNSRDGDDDLGPTIIDSVFLGNWANDSGGGMYNAMASPTLINSLFSGNMAEDWGGGGMFNSGANPTLINSTLVGNWASDGGGGIYNSNSSPKLTNSIVWGNRNNQITANGASQPAITFSVVQDGWEGEGNLDIDPRFVDADGQDGIAGTRDDNLQLSFGSPSIDAGDNSALSPLVTVDLAGNLRRVDDPNTPDLGNGYPPLVDMGAYEFMYRRIWFVDDDAPNDPAPGVPEESDPQENGSVAHPFDAIQEAIAAASDGEVVLVLDGTYIGTGNRNIDFLGKAITVRSQNGPENSIIDGSEEDDKGANRSFYFHRGETADSVLDGFTLTGGYAQYGGAILVEASSPTIINCDIVDNAAQFEGGGVLFRYGGDPTLRDSTISGNRTGRSGGGIYTSSPSNLTLTGCVVEGNRAWDGGGLFSSGNVTVVESVFADNTATGLGGGVYWGWGNNEDTMVSFTDSMFSRNQAGAGGGLASGGNATLKRCIISNNEAESEGGGVYAYDGSLTLTDSTFEANSADHGAGLAIQEAAADVTDSTFLQNRAGGEGGGGIYIGPASSVVVTGSTFRGNSSAEDPDLDPNTGRGGAIQNVGNDPVITDCTFIGNSAGQGGGMNNQGGAPTVTNSSFLGNWANDGGGIANWSSNPTIINSIFSGNTANDHGGGVSNDNSGSVLINCTFSRNSAESGGGLAAFDDSRVTIVNSILSDNAGKNIYRDADECVTVRYSSLDRYWYGNTNIYRPAKLIDPDGPDDIVGTEDDNLRPSTTSPSLNAGNNAEVPSGITTDRDGNARIVFDTVDMGAYEFQRGRTIHVDDDAEPGGDGFSWADAYSSLQDAMEEASLGSTIYVAAGVYTPSSGVTAEDREVSFQLKNLVTIRGGFAGQGAQDPDARDVRRYETILSGDLTGNDAVVHRASRLKNHLTRLDNSLHVIQAEEGIDRTAVLDGFTIIGGYNADGEGAGLLCDAASPTIRNSTFIGNAAVRGGASWNYNGSSPLFLESRFFDNFAFGNGGAMASDQYRGLVEIENCLFAGNISGNSGGAIYNNDANQLITNSTFADNIAGDTAGAIYNEQNTMLLDNSIVWNNWDSEPSDQETQVYPGARLVVSYSDIEGYPSEPDAQGNFGADPLFLHPASRDYRLQFGSPCIDAGQDAGVEIDLNHTARPYDVPGVDNNGFLPDYDIGAFEYVGPTYADDAYEQNDSLDTAYDLHRHSGSWLWQVHGRATQADDDFYRIQTELDDPWVLAVLKFDDENDQLALEAFDRQGGPWEPLEQRHGRFHVSIELAPWEISYLKVSGDNGGQEYELWWGTPLAGDANLDGFVDLSDFNAWNAHKFTTDTDWLRGDFNRDGVTDLSDFNVWNAQKFTSTAAKSLVDPAPEMSVAPAPNGADILGAKLAWLATLQRSAERDTADNPLSQQAVDQLLASYWP